MASPMDIDHRFQPAVLSDEDISGVALHQTPDLLLRRRYHSDSGTNSSSLSDSLPGNRSRWKQRRHQLAYTFPVIVSGYVQMIFNLVVVLGLLYAGFFFFQVISHDVEIKIDEYSKDALAEIALCSRQYIDNRCTPPEQRIPAMEHTCTMWEKCMNRDPRVVGRAKISAETLAEILNGFVEPISYKTMIFFVGAVFSFVMLSNFALRSARQRDDHRKKRSHGVASYYR